MKKKTGAIMLVAMLLPPLLFAQAQIIFNGGEMVISNSGKIVVANASANAISRTGAGGGIVSEGAGNSLLWQIGTNTASYTVPFLAADGSYIPVSFTPSGASGNGYFELSTYEGPNWQNSNYLPPTVTNVNHYGTDNSAYTIDRFWQVNAAGYAAKPSVNNLSFTYRSIEFSETGNAINESNLQAQRWNSDINQWGDYGPVGSDNSSNHSVNISSVGSNDLYAWWTLVDNSSILPVSLVSFTAQPLNSSVKLNWLTASEVNTNYFTVQKTQDMSTIVAAGNNVAAAGNSIIQHNYSLIDQNPFSGKSFYRLKITGKDGGIIYSNWVPVSFTGKNAIQVFPNPAKDYLFVSGINPTAASEIIIADISGRTLKQVTASGGTIQISLAGIASGTYILKVINADGSSQSFKIVKQ